LPDLLLERLQASVSRFTLLGEVVFLSSGTLPKSCCQQTLL
jgi:hypothetical protein